MKLAVATWKMFWLFRKEQFDIVHTHTQVVGLIGRVVAFLANTYYNPTKHTDSTIVG